MKSAFLLSAHTNLFQLVADALTLEHSIVSGPRDGMVQMTDERGRLFTVFDGVPEGFEYEYQDGPFADSDGRLYDTSTLAVCIIECRWEEWFASVLGRLADRIDAELLVLDSAGTIWPASNVDPARIVL